MRFVFIHAHERIWHITTMCRRVVGWALRPRLDQQLTLAALQMALTHWRAASMLHHSDRGAQYGSYAYQSVLASVGATASMSRRGTAGTTPWSRASLPP